MNRPAGFSRALALGLAASLAFASAACAQWKPGARTEIVIPSGPASGLDLAGRSIKSLLEQLRAVPVATVVVNKPGAGGTIAYGYLNQHPGDGGYIALASPSLVTNRMMGIGSIDHGDLTAICRLFSDNVVFMVRADSAFTDVRGLVGRLAGDPGSVSFGIATALGGANHLAAAIPLKAAKVDVSRMLNVVYKAGSEATIALIGGHVDVVPVAAPVAVAQLKAGRIRVIAAASEKRLGGALANVPTLREQGVDASYSAWRVVVAPRGLAEEQVRYWEAAFARLAALPEWQALMESNLWAGEYLDARETVRFLERQAVEHRTVLDDLGLRK